jgi:hypothetical protein
MMALDADDGKEAETGNLIEQSSRFITIMDI